MELIVYLLKVNTALALFYGIYRLLFRQDTFFQWKRVALLTIIFISFLYPFIDLTRQLIANRELESMLATVRIPIYNLPEVVITGNATVPDTFLPQVIGIIYILVFAGLLIRIGFQIGTIVYKLRHTTKKRLFEQTVYESSGLETPFSFLHWIVLDSSRYSEAELQEILLHETAHVEQRHSIDTLLAELVCAFCWFNPFSWLLKTEIRLNLEFLADRSVLSSGCGAEHYQFHLLRLSYHKAAAKITNNFNVSLLKKRIFMMNKKQTSHRSIWKYALILPVVALLLFYNCTFQSKTKPDNATNVDQQKTDTITAQPADTATVQDDLVVNNFTIYNHVDVMPQFPGGEGALLKWLKDNVNYPTVAAEHGVQGRVVVRFIVSPDGSVKNVEIQKSLDPACDKEAMRAIKTMPNWIPGKQNGKAVYVYYSLPVVYKLQAS